MIRRVKNCCDRVHSILFESDLMNTRLAIGLSSFMFAAMLLLHWIQEGHTSDLFWIAASIFHTIATFWALMTERVSKFTFFSEAFLGFLLWNYLSLVNIIAGSFASTVYAPSGAALAPTFIIGLSTWWVLSRYPQKLRNSK